jgi:hypothetical protein
MRPKWRLLALLLAAAPVLAEERTLEIGNGKTLRYELVEEAAQPASARDTARQLLQHLAAGDIGKAAALSNVPAQRQEVFLDYRKRVGEDEFRRVFARYLERAHAIVAEVAIGTHRLIIWDLGASDAQLTGQYYVESGTGFLLDDVPSETRADLRRVLEAYRRDSRATR